MSAQQVQIKAKSTLAKASSATIHRGQVEGWPGPSDDDDDDNADDDVNHGDHDGK